MKSMPKWLFLPPAVAALLLLGTVSMQSGANADPVGAKPAGGAPAAASSQPAPSAGAANRSSVDAAGNTTGSTGSRLSGLAGADTRANPTLPRTPDLTQMASALLGVLLLGAGGVLLVRRLRSGPRAPRGGSLLALRQTLRVSARQAIHAIEFDDRILLIGETDKSLALLDTGRLPERAADEVEIASRRAPASAANTGDHADGDDDGATPRNLLIPRPANPLPARIPTRPLGKQLAAAKTEVAPPTGLANFRNLLQKVGRA
jgi:flagellar biogenesis protein FliO